MIKKFGVGFDAEVLKWKSESTQSNCKTPKYILVGDNVDKNVRPRFMRVDRQVQSIHAWHQYASLNRFDMDSVTASQNLRDIKACSVIDFLPSVADTASLRSKYIVLVSRVLVDKLQFLRKYADVVPKHIVHPLTTEMSSKSTVVPLGVIPKNENKNEELISLLEIVQEYIPRTQEGDPQMCVIAGDQLTSERIYNAQLIRSASETSEMRLDCFLPIHSDWHTQVVYLQVHIDNSHL